MYHIKLILFALIPVWAVAPNGPFEKWDTEVLLKANTAKEVQYLTQDEKNVIFYTNLARMDGKLFVQTILPYWIDSIGRKDDKWSRSLEKDLKSSPSLPPLAPREDLYKEARSHAKDMGKSGKMGHRSSRGKSFEKRLGHFTETYTTVNENCQYGYSKGIDIVIDLLIDEGISNYGHRKNIMNPDARYIGVAIEKHKKFKYNCVMDFGGELRTN